MKNFYLLLASMCIAVSVTAQTLAEWPLDGISESNPTNVATDITASTFIRGNGISSLDHQSSGTKATSWSSSTTKEEVDYYEICITVDAGKTANITAIEFQERRSSDGARNFSLVYSKDNFTTGTHLADVAIPDDTAWRSYDQSVNIKITNGEQLCLRWYAYDAEDPAGDWEIAANSLRVEGEIMAACVAPSITAPIHISNINSSTFELNLSAGDGGGRVVFLRKGAPVEAVPYQGDSYTSSPVFGNGDLVGKDTYVVGLTASSYVDLTISNLEEGVTYHIAVYEFNFSGLCYNSIGVSDNATTLCSNVSTVQDLLCSAINESISLLWNSPNCFDEILVVVSDSPISGYPTGDGSQYDINSTFGSGAPNADFGSSGYPVYLGSANKLTIDGLTNNTTYYIAVYARYNNIWSHAVIVTDKPTAGCSDLSGEAIFFNEIHYKNIGEEQDVGFEIVGPAGVDLSIYEVYLYQTTSLSEPESMVTAVTKLDGVLDDEGNGMGAAWFPFPEMPTAAAGLALYNTVRQEVVQFIGYRQSHTGFDGPAVGMFAPYIQEPNGNMIQEFGTQAIGNSIYLSGEGQCPSDFEWVKGPATIDDLNTGQAIVLPVDIVDFGAEKHDEKIRLYWQTAIEINSDYFEIEHSQNGRDFVSIGQVTAAFYSQNLEDYELWDYSPVNGINYYRLKQVDIDGTVHYHGVVSVRIDGKVNEKEITIFPNPVTNHTTISWEVNAIEIQLYDPVGRLVFRKPLPNAPGSTSLELEELHSGMYSLLILDGYEVHAKQFIKQ